MKRVQYDLDFKLEILRKGKEMGNLTAVARQHELDPKMVLRWSKLLDRKDVNKLDGTGKRQAAFIPTADDFKQLEHENKKLKKLLAEQALEREILKNLLKKTNSGLRIK